MRGRWALLTFLCAFSTELLAERFLTWIDEEGNVRHTRVQSVEEAESKPSVDNQPPVVAPAEEEQSSTPDQEDALQPPLAAEANAESNSETSTEPKAVVPLEPVLESESNPRPLPDIAVQLRDRPEPVAPNSSSLEINPDEYIDAAELEARGFVREGEERFYTWIDGEGNLRSAPISDLPGPPEGAQLTVSQQALRNRQAVVANEQRVAAADASLEADPAALAMLGLDDSSKTVREIETVIEACCEGLKDGETQPFKAFNDLLIYLEDPNDTFNFGIGVSRYRVVSIPESIPNESLMRLRSFVTQGMFSPAIVTLDENWQPVRLLTDILYSYSPETWLQHGYMEGFFSIDADDEERYLVFFSRGIDQRSRTVVDGLSEEPLVIPHQGTGGLYIELVPAS